MNKWINIVIIFIGTDSVLVKPTVHITTLVHHHSEETSDGWLGDNPIAIHHR